MRDADGDLRPWCHPVYSADHPGDMRGRVALALVGTLIGVILLGACADDTEPTLDSVEVTDLPEIRTESEFDRLLAARRSVRAFTPADLTQDQIGRLLWAAQGVTAEWGGRTAPSAGALYPLEVFVVTSDGVDHYLPEDHRSERTTEADVREELAGAALDQEALHSAPAVFVIAAEYARTEARYGDRAERYAHLEAGHAAQNLLLRAVALGLGAVPIGAFDDAAVQEVLGLPPQWVPLYLIPVGVPAEG
jgi:SagB-type dehydrogenase family enzyme